MKTNILTLTIIATAILFHSCAKEIEFHGDETDPKLVINSLVEPGKPVTAYITKSYFFLDDVHNTVAPDDLVATLFVNGNRIGEMTPRVDTVWDLYQYDSLGNNTFSVTTIYYNDYRPAVGDLVSIIASANGYDDASGVSSPLPQSADWSLGEFEMVYWEKSYYLDGNDTVWSIEAKFELDVSIRDVSPNQTDYYRLLARNGSYNDFMYDESCIVSPVYDDPVFGDVESELGLFDSYSFRAEGAFTDLLFDGKNYQIKLPFFVSIRYKNQVAPDAFRAPIVMQHLTKEYYNYLNTCEQDDEMMQLVAEPVQTYTNVEGGYGIVGGQAVDTLWIVLPLDEP